jgi:hypothetical protein
MAGQPRSFDPDLGPSGRWSGIGSRPIVADMNISSPTPELAEPESSETPISETEAAEIEDRLRSLGYIE